MAAKYVQALNGPSELDGGRHRLLGRGGRGSTAHVDAAILPLGGGGGSLPGRGSLGAGRTVCGLAALLLVSLHALILLRFLIFHAIIGLGLLLSVQKFADSLQDLVGAHLAQLLASILPGLPLLCHHVHGLLNQSGDVAGGRLNRGVAFLALSFGLGLLLQGLLYASLDFLGQLVGLHLHRLAATRGGSVLGLGDILAHLVFLLSK